jgi:hypothetical protein
MFDPSTFSTESVTSFKEEGWEDNRFRLPVPGTKCVGVIEKLDHGKEWARDGKTYMGLAVTLRSTQPAGVTASGYLNSQPRPYGNKVSALEDLVQVSGIEFDGNLTNRAIAEIIAEIHRDQIPIGFDITWEGYCNSLFELTLMTATSTNSIDEANQVADDEQVKEAKKSAKFTASQFRVNGKYESSIECEQTGQTVRARTIIRNLLLADDVDDQLGG